MLPVSYLSTEDRYLKISITFATHTGDLLLLLLCTFTNPK